MILKFSPLIQRRSLLVLFTAQIIALYIKDATTLKHHLVLTEDDRYQVSVSSFGYNLYGRLEVIIENLTLNPDPSEFYEQPQFGFVLMKTDEARHNYAAEPSQQVAQPTCLLNDPRNQLKLDLMVFSVLPRERKISLKCSGNSTGFPNITSLSDNPRRKGSQVHSSYIHKYDKRAATADGNLNKSVNYDSLSAMTANEDNMQPEQRKTKYSPLFHECPDSPEFLPLEITSDTMDRRSYSLNFTFLITKKEQEANYFLSFLNCRGYHYNPFKKHNDPDRFVQTTKFNLSMLIFETNFQDNFLSAGSIPLPQMYFIFSVLFFLSGCIWVNFISRQRDNMLKIHNLMTVLVFAKAFSLLFHGINFHYIALDGQPVVTWAYLYYATRAVKGALFFLTLALIGSGWTFIKHILSPRDKTLILMVVTMQIFAHIFEIALDESTEGERSIEFWWELCGLVDLFSCVFILLPITWSVRHLEETSKTDGKAAINLKKLELFKSFYIVSTIYIYVSRIVTFIFLSMLRYKYSWLAELFTESATLAYFIVTGYYFQPMPTNPYLLLSTDTDMEEDILFSVDAHEMNGMREFDTSAATSGNSHTNNEENDQMKKRRNVVEDFV